MAIARAIAVRLVPGSGSARRGVGALADVHDWSRYREDPIGRLTSTVRWVITLTYGATTQPNAETARVGRFHCRVLWNRNADLVKLG
ncbi:oxygenase MpaB family protein [Microbacterium sp. 11MF]|uniref:oxygenase MpaB family protein n=1 Tax=Microbacterium sp. 11MF TaxID=1169146 RepID=UPI00036A423B